MIEESVLVYDSMQVITDRYGGAYYTADQEYAFTLEQCKFEQNDSNGIESNESN